MEYNTIPSDETIRTVVASLKENGMEAVVVENGSEAKEKVLEMLPEGAEVMNMTSITLTTIGLESEILESGKFKPVRSVLNDENAEPRLKRQLGAGPDYTVGSVHALTEKGQAVIASNTGSQLPAYAYGAGQVIWVVGAQKIVPDLDGAMKRIYEHVLPLESERAHKAYGVAGSNVSKLLIVNKEVNPDRIKLIIVKEALGF
jgi:hypothetical protein